jgi:hypothetical protein
VALAATALLVGGHGCNTEGSGTSKVGLSPPVPQVKVLDDGWALILNYPSGFSSKVRFIEEKGRVGIAKVFIVPPLPLSPGEDTESPSQAVIICADMSLRTIHSVDYLRLGIPTTAVTCTDGGGVSSIAVYDWKTGSPVVSLTAEEEGAPLRRRFRDEHTPRRGHEELDHSARLAIEAEIARLQAIVDGAISILARSRGLAEVK